ncbi:hypothetical protein PC128_g6743 [Phytophthora cactorum]|nr:hypothetical protein PC128_g6743 [Phytophthora cactorum]
MSSREYDDQYVDFGDAVSEIFRTEEEEVDEAALQQVAPPAIPPSRTTTPDSSAASSEATESGDESSSSGASDSSDVTTRTGPNTVWNVDKQVLKSASGGNSGGQIMTATMPTGAALTNSTTTASVSVPGVTKVGIPTAQKVVAVMGPPREILSLRVWQLRDF